MEFSKGEQLTSDIDWFAFDQNGELAHFASFSRFLPKSVACSKENNKLLTNYFRKDTLIITESKVEPTLKNTSVPS